MQNILKKEYGKNGIYKNGYCPESLIKYICEKYEWEYCDFPFDFDLSKNSENTPASIGSE